MTASSLPIAAPETLGLCPRRLTQFGDFLRRDIETGRLPGAVVLIARHGQIGFFEAFGQQNPETGQPMQRESVFRLASLTKPITSVAALMLVEQGLLRLDQPLAEFVPEFAHLSVADGRPARPATLHDLLRHTAGFTYGEFGDGPVHARYRALNPLDPAQTAGEMIGKLAQLPLLYSPGTTFEYGMSTDVLGHILERRSGCDLETLFRTQIFAPLGMVDTSFLLRPPLAPRLAQAVRDPDGRRPWMPVFRDDDTPPNWHSGGSGLVGTAQDYFLFLQNLLDGLTCAAPSLLAPKTLAWMTANHLADGIAYGAYMPALGLLSPQPERGQGFGLGFLIRLATGLNSAPGSVGDFSWAGVSGTYAWADPSEGLVAVLMTQAPQDRDRLRAVTRHFVYQALTDIKTVP